MFKGSTSERTVFVDEYDERAIDFGQATISAKC